MFRSVSTSRVSEDSYYSIYNHSPSSKAVSPALRALSLEANELPLYETSTTPKKDRLGRGRLSEKSVHLIPLVLLLCALVLWFFSNPEINMPIKNELNANATKTKSTTDIVERDVDSSAITQLQHSHADLELSKHEGGGHHNHKHKLANSNTLSL